MLNEQPFILHLTCHGYLDEAKQKKKPRRVGMSRSVDEDAGLEAVSLLFETAGGDG